VPIVERVSTESKRVALTFDDGPHPGYTVQILDTLAAEGALATFFIRGSAVDAETSEIVKRTVAEGHDVGNHTHSHLSFDGCSDTTIDEEIRRTHFQLEEILGRPPDLIRPPYGHGLAAVDAIASRLGYRATVLWTFLVNDWKNRPAESIVQDVLDGLTPGAIVLLHDGCDGRQPEGPGYSPQGTVAALRPLIPKIRERGYELVTVSQLLDE
jgi:peptidoglycan/xylan/chitin deacetylase (PgdA/CDA1 family)